MTVASRLALVEAALSPTELVLRWLAEAHAYDDLGSYSAALLDADPSTFPMDRLAREAKASATERSRGRPRSEAERAVRAAIVAAVFRVQLVLRINVLAADFVDREVLIQGALSAHLGLAIEDSASPAGHRASLGIVRCRDLLLGRVTELHAMDAARGRVEARFLDGAPSLFPAGQRRWEEQRTQSETMAVLALRLAELDGFDPPPPDDAAAVEARVEQLVADHVEPTRSSAYSELGDGRRAIAVATRWLRPKLTAGALVGVRGPGAVTPPRPRQDVERGLAPSVRLSLTAHESRDAFKDATDNPGIGRVVSAIIGPLHRPDAGRPTLLRGRPAF